MKFKPNDDFIVNCMLRPQRRDDLTHEKKYTLKKSFLNQVCS